MGMKCLKNIEYDSIVGDPFFIIKGGATWSMNRIYI